MSKKEIAEIRSLIENAEKSIEEAKNIFQRLTGDEIGSPPKAARNFSFNPVEDAGKVVEGKFDGQSMIDDAGKLYPVPANYASKSKLVEGDRLKLTIAQDGSFLFKQIGPVDRRRVIAAVKQDPGTRGYILEAEGKIYKVLFASITYFKVASGDSVVALIPKDKESSWAAIENVLQGGSSENFGSPEADLNKNDSDSSFSVKEEHPAKNEEMDIDAIIGETIVQIEKEEEKNSAGARAADGENANGFEW